MVVHRMISSRARLRATGRRLGHQLGKETTMLALLWNLSAAIRGYLRFYMPTNRALDWLRTPRGLKWAIPVTLVAVLGYLGAMAICVQLAARPGLSSLNVLVLLFFWNAAKFAWIAVLCPFLWLATARRLYAHP
jgi:hypothetical protein